MCGFVGVIGSIDNNQIRYMLDLISHRGPDDRGYYSDINNNINYTPDEGVDHQISTVALAVLKSLTS